MQSSPSFLSLIALVVVLCTSNAFAPKPALTRTTTATQNVTPLFGFLGDKERDRLSRDNEPEDFFAT
jgi:hypothetical protein